MEAVETQDERRTETETAVRVGDAEPRSPGADPETRGENAVEAFARDHEGLTEDDERDALDFLLAPKPPRLYGVPVEYDTEAGTKRLTFVVRGMDGRQLDKIEQRNVSDVTGKIDAISAECQLVAEACVFLEGRAGHQVKLASDEFLTIRVQKPDGEPGEMVEQRLASPADALEARFRTQLGLVSGVAGQVRRISGYDARRIGDAQRRLSTAVGNS